MSYFSLTNAVATADLCFSWYLCPVASIFIRVGGIIVCVQPIVSIYNCNHRPGFSKIQGLSRILAVILITVLELGVF